MTEVQPFSLGRNDTQAPAVLSGLDRLGDKLGRYMRSVLEPMIGAKPKVTVTPVEMTTYGFWGMMLPDFVSLGIYRMLPLKGMVLLRMDAGMITALVDCFYGGRGMRNAVARKEFTPTEERLLNRLSEEIVTRLSDAWADVLKVDAALVARETSFAHAEIAAEDEQVVVQKIDVDLGAGVVWPIEIVYPLTALRSVEAMMGSKTLEEPQKVDAHWQMRLSHRMREVRVPARTVLARPQLSLSELMELEVGDVIPVSIARSLPLIVGNRVVAYGTIGDQEGQSAFMIEKMSEGPFA